LTTSTEHTVQSWSMPYKYRAIVHSPHSWRGRLSVKLRLCIIQHLVRELC